MTKRNTTIGYVVLAKRQREDGSDDYQGVSAVWPDRKTVEATRRELIDEAKHAGHDTEYTIGEIRSAHD